VSDPSGTVLVALPKERIPHYAKGILGYLDRPVPQMFHVETIYARRSEVFFAIPEMPLKGNREIHFGIAKGIKLVSQKLGLFLARAFELAR
jgi:hypothetical protein